MYLKNQKISKLFKKHKTQQLKVKHVYYSTEMFKQVLGYKIFDYIILLN